MSEQETTEPVQAETDGRSTLEVEGDIAADYIEELLDIADLDGDIDIDVRDGRAYLEVNSDEEGTNLDRLSSPAAVNALQELTRLAVQQKTGEFTRLVLDVQGSRERRAEELDQIVANAAERLRGGRDRVDLQPLSSYERKLVHDFARERSLNSESEGEGRSRHVVLTLADSADEQH